MVAVHADPNFHVRLTALAKARKSDPWRATRRPNQTPPEGSWRTWLLMAGRGFGKTRTAAEYVREQITDHGKQRVALVGATAADVRDVMVDGESGLLACCERYGVRATYQPSRRRVIFPNGAMAFMYSADEPNRLRGPQHDCFVAGTMILTPSGERPIESLQVGDWVVTRFGPRRITDMRHKPAEVGRVTFDNGAELLGTADHPIRTLQGWEPLSALAVGDSVCTGEKRPTATWRPIETARRSTSTVGSGSNSTDRFRRVITSTTGTATQRTTTPATSNSFPRRLTSGIMLQWLNGRSLPASIAAAMWFVGFARIAALQCAGPASTSGPRNDAKGSGRVETAALRSSAARGTTAVSVASTWAHVGNQTVYNLTVEHDHEYIANGIVVHNCAWGDEPAAWRYPAAYENLDMGLRLGDDPRMVLTTTPRPVTLVRALVKRAREQGDVVVTRGRTLDNEPNLSPGFVAAMQDRYAGTRLGRQELEGELLEDVEGALWTLDLIDAHRLDAVPADVRLSVIAVGVDPAVSANEDSNETGIVVVARGSDGHGYVLADRSLRGSPHEWGTAAVAAYHEFSADRIVPETNNGGDMVVSTLRTVDRRPRIRPVHASRGKVTRAEPVAALYEQGKVHHVGTFPGLEDQMSAWVPGMTSPDRMDALVWAATDVLLGHGNNQPTVW